MIERVGLFTNQRHLNKFFKKQEPVYNYNDKVITMPYNSAYNVAFLGKKDYSENELNYFNFKRNLSNKYHKLCRDYHQKNWEFEANSNDENLKKYSIAYDNYMELATDKKVLDRLLNFQSEGVSDPKLKKSLEKLLKDYRETVTNKDDLKSLNDKTKAIGQKFNGYKGEVSGKKYSNAELREMKKTEKNVALRKEIYEALNVKNGNLIANDLIELVKIRNKYAQKNGYKDFFSYQIAEVFETDEKKLFELLDDLDKKTIGIFKEIKDIDDQKLASAFGIKPEDLMPWHYGLELEDSPILEADKYIKNNDMLTQLSTSMYKKMGWDLSKMPILFDLFSRENKNQHGFCFDIDKNKDVRVLLNLRNDIDSVETLNHELGHAVYDMGISEHLAYFDRKPASSALTEAVAMLMESLPNREGFFIDELNMPEELVKRLEIERKKDLVYFVREYLKFINFEKQLYANPDQDVAKLWYELGNKYKFINIPQEIGNAWASIPHFLTHPAYLQNYLRAEIMAANIYEHATQKLGPLTKNTNTAEFFRKKLLRLGSSLTEEETIKTFTGKAISVDAMCRQFEGISKLIK